MALYYSGAWAEHIYYLTVYLVIRLFVYIPRQEAEPGLAFKFKEEEGNRREGNYPPVTILSR